MYSFPKDVNDLSLDMKTIIVTDVIKAYHIDPLYEEGFETKRTNFTITMVSRELSRKGYCMHGCSISNAMDRCLIDGKKVFTKSETGIGRYECDADVFNRFYDTLDQKRIEATLQFSSKLVEGIVAKPCALRSH
jgi:hypothetical protein